MKRQTRYRPKVRVAGAGDYGAPSEVPPASAYPALGTPRRADSSIAISALFTVLVLGALLVLAASAGANLAIVSSGFAVRFLSLFIEAAPFLLLGSIASGLIDSFVSPDHIARLIPRNRFLGVLIGTFAGFVFPVCECGVVP